MKPIAAALVVVALAAAAASSAAASPATKTIATTTLDDFRVVLTAKRGPSVGGAPSASVELRAYRRGLRGFRLLDRQVVGPPNGFFWFPLVGRGAVREFSVGTRPDRVTFQVLVTPSIGWSPRYRFHVTRGRLVRG